MRFCRVRGTTSTMCVDSMSQSDRPFLRTGCVSGQRGIDARATDETIPQTHGGHALRLFDGEPFTSRGTSRGRQLLAGSLGRPSGDKRQLELLDEQAQDSVLEMAEDEGDLALDVYGLVRDRQI